jgi:hypothetical protein
MLVPAAAEGLDEQDVSDEELIHVLQVGSILDPPKWRQAPSHTVRF